MKLKKEDILHLEAKSRTFKDAALNRMEKTSAEDILWESLRNRRLNGLKFRRQHPLLRFIADFYCHEAKLVVEVDGGIHDEQFNTEHDEGRTYELNNYGITVIRFKNEEVISKLNTVLDQINLIAMNLITITAKASPAVNASPPAPSPEGEGKNPLNDVGTFISDVDNLTI